MKSIVTDQQLSYFSRPIIQKIESKVANSFQVDIYVLRLDVIHPFINGNKWFKLKYNLAEAKDTSSTTIVTFGGAYSNHIYATAAAGNLFGFKTIGIIRGEENKPLNQTLSFAVKKGMDLIYLDRQAYKQKSTELIQENLKKSFEDAFFIPEGGCNLNGVRGCTEIIDSDMDFDVVCLACGTATTLTGIALSLGKSQRVIGFPVLKNGGFLKLEIEKLMQLYLQGQKTLPGHIELMSDYHFGGYGKVNQNLVNFKQEFEQIHNIPLDYIYTAKMFYGVIDLIKKGYFSRCRLLLVHTGGLQGNLGIENKLK
ncbi:1-aminocyclopropane-1-carboxylate deaminase/D-cysteine desulfhydrase [Calothrix sp. PCC 6303]|uniref:1-aminocyclopropane-1-carboxylate deaminase/D-cysteine desulfhydrase n=1 Tax=Calothrix sp. PCC 6303 TaxID=1170562 RepID=UPI0002A006CD|nr:1-aminocyclopropane-1-carboxylate deaminase/D-cysteine desulfhydrase [Calothrix sp. PCC 6303]AFZ03168.1 1-aminocyclopropane-1-carboxylate deaminase [Calothrix sp. PCC 6303]